MTETSVALGASTWKSRDVTEKHTPDPNPSSQSPLSEVWSIAWPTVLTMTSYTAMQFIDKLMIGQVGPLEVAAQGNGGVWAFSIIAFVLGLLTVVNTYVSQNLGAGKPEKGTDYAWAAIWLCLGIWIVFVLPYSALMGPVFDWVHDAQLDRLKHWLAEASGTELLRARAEEARLYKLILLETQYARILLVGALILMVGRAIHHFFFGLGRPKVVTVAAISGNLTNVLVNYALIFGDQGIPALGVPGVPGLAPMGLVGAALGTIAGTFVEAVLPLGIFLGSSLNRALNSRARWIKDLVKIGLPAAIQTGNEILCWSIFMSRLMGLFGTYHQTAGWIAVTYMHLSFMPAIGLSVAVTTLVGKYVGAGQPDVAVARARLGLILAVIYMTACGLFFLLFRYELVGVFVGGQDLSSKDAEQILQIGATLMICAAFFQAFDAFGIIYTGALRGAGDTIWPGIVTVIYSWGFILGGGWFMGTYFAELESAGPWIAAWVYILFFGMTMAWRFESGGWRNLKLVESTQRDAARLAPVGPGLPESEPEATIRDIAQELGEGRAREQ